MKTIGIIAEFNPFHNGHKYLIEKSMQETGADFCIVIMSGDFVQRGAPAIADKFIRTRMALQSGADLVLELPVYYSLGSAEYFASGAVSILDRIGALDYLCFGSESGDISSLEKIATVLANEPENFRSVLAAGLKAGKSFAAAREDALASELDGESIRPILQSPNNILAIEYIKALIKRNSSIRPFTIPRIGESFHSTALSDYASATAIRKVLAGNTEKEAVSASIPASAMKEFVEYSGHLLDSNDFSTLLNYRLICDKENGYDKYLDVSGDLSNKLINSFTPGDTITCLCEKLKTKDLSYSRISRSLFHILLGITDENMAQYKADDYTGYVRILGLKKDSSAVLSLIHDNSSLPVLDRLKDAEHLLNPLQMRLLSETLSAGAVYNLLAQNGVTSEYSLRNIVI
ncbi:nucleotidyltransferase [Butyrivibrio sp. AE3009]|uniref:nucleotidyltransferase n=1 Tax=Butyrivibrio sp. AE3009 TaxID=1280666 RepID=UPI0003B4FCBB|nr:nucleotidyltransferase [Butyrivibrio sp. AE3009]